MTRKLRGIAYIAALTGIFTFALRVRASDDKTFKGEISDSQCALNVHSKSRSHKEMMGMSSELSSEAACVRYCVKERGGRMVLLAKDRVYKLDAQALAEAWAGQKVKVVGTLDPKTNTISIASIEPLTPGPGNPPR